MLDAVQQRVLGVLIEKELAVPDSYPLTEATLLAGCNQKSNRDPEMELGSEEVHAALLALREAGFVTRIDTSARSTRYRHHVDTLLGLGLAEKSVLCELLVRGAQAPGALKPRVARLGWEASPQEIQALLERLRARSGEPLVREEARRPRERDNRWIHTLGPREESAASEGADEESPHTAPAATARAAPTHAAPAHAARAAPAMHSSAAHATPATHPPTPATQALLERIDRLERQVVALHEEVYRLRKLVEQ